MGVCVGQLWQSNSGRLWEVVDESPRGWWLTHKDRRIRRTTRELRSGSLWRLITPSVGPEA
jgi:hypothetical protein